MFVKPGPDPRAPKDAPRLLKVRDPVLKDFLPDEGREVGDHPYWHRRLRDGDVVLAEPPAEATT